MKGNPKISAAGQIKMQLVRGEKVSQLQALRDYGCMRLAAVIHRLRAKGIDIETTWRTQKGKKYAVYRLRETAPE
jgi:hypothetical protein